MTVNLGEFLRAQLEAAAAAHGAPTLNAALGGLDATLVGQLRNAIGQAA